MCPAAHCLILICISVQHHVCSFNRSCAVPRHLFSCGSLNFPMCSSLSFLGTEIQIKKEEGKRWRSSALSRNTTG